MNDFDKGCSVFTAGMQTAAGWKHHYFGAAYSTRLRQAITAARMACDQMEKVLEEDDARGKAALAAMHQS